MNVKQLREFLDREESLWTEDRKKWFGDFDLTPVVIDTITGYSEMEGMYLGEISSIMFYPVASAKVETHVPISPIGCPAWGEIEDLDDIPYGHHNYLSNSTERDETEGI